MKKQIPKEYVDKISLALPDRREPRLEYVHKAGCYTDAVFIDDDLVALFGYKNQDFSPGRTVDICDAIRSEVTVPIPSAVYRGDNWLIGPRFSGKPLTRAILQDLPAKTKRSIAEKIGLFLAQLLNVELSTLDRFNLRDNTKAEPYEKVESTINDFIKLVFPHLMRPAQRWIQLHCQSMDRVEYENWQAGVQHGELVPPHIYFDYGKQMFTGILDFDQATIGDPADNLFWLLWDYGQSFVDLVVETNPQLKRHYKRARFLFGYSMLRWSLKGVTEGPKWFGNLLTIPFDFKPLTPDE